MEPIQESIERFTNGRKYSYTNYPQDGWDLTGYERIIEKVIAKLSHTPGVLSLYQSGTVSVPGISDLDLFVIIDPRRPPSVQDLSLNCLNLAEKELVHHPLTIYTPSLLQRFAVWGTGGDLYHRWGIKWEIPAVQEDIANLSKMIQLGEWLFRSIPRELLRLLFKVTIPIRYALWYLHSLCHSLSLWQDLGQQVQPAWSDWHRSFTLFRGQWFNQTEDRKKHLISYLNHGIVIGLQLQIAYSRLLQQRWLSCCVPQRGGVADLRYLTCWDKDCHGLGILKKMLSHIQRKGYPLIWIPCTLSVPLAELAKASGPASHALRCVLRNPALYKMDNRLREAYRNRAQFMNEHVQVLIELGVSQRQAPHFSIGYTLTGAWPNRYWLKKIAGEVLRPHLRRLVTQPKLGRQNTAERFLKIMSRFQ